MDESVEMAACTQPMCTYVVKRWRLLIIYVRAWVKSSTVECDAGGVETKLRPQGDVTGTSNLAHIVVPFSIVYMLKKVSENSDFRSYGRLPKLKRYSAHMNPGRKNPEAFAGIETIRTRFPQPLLSMP